MDGVGAPEVGAGEVRDVLRVGGVEAVLDGGVERWWGDEGDVRAGFEEEEEAAGGDEAAADEQDGAVLEAVGEEEGGAFVDGRVGGG